MIAVRLPKEIESRLDNLAKLTGRTKTFYVREAILDHLEDLEDIYIAEGRHVPNLSGRYEGHQSTRPGDRADGNALPAQGRAHLQAGEHPERDLL